MPRGSLGRADENTLVMNPDTGLECPRARFDAMIDQKFDAYIRIVTDRRSSGCQGIPCSWLEQNRERCAKGAA